MARTFANYADLITFSRASSATYLDSDGLLKTATTNIPRIEYDADGNRLGLLVEEQRTNLVPYSEDFSNAAWLKVALGSGSTPTVTANAGIAPDGTLTATRLVCSLNGGSESTDRSYITQSVSGDNVFHSASFWAKSNVSGTQKVVLSIAGVNPVEVTLDGEWRRFNTEWEATNNSPSPRIGITGTQASVDACDILIWGAQVEAGSFPTSYIPTSGSTATRAADVASIPVSDFGYNPSEGTVMVEGVVGKDTLAGIFTLQDSPTTVNERVSLLRTSTAALETVIQTTGGVQLQQFENTVSNDAAFKAAVSFKKNSGNSSFNGNIEIEDTSLDVPTTLSVLMVGRYGSSAYMNGHIKSIKYYPRRLTNDQLQELTA